MPVGVATPTRVLLATALDSFAKQGKGKPKALRMNPLDWAAVVGERSKVNPPASGLVFVSSKFGSIPVTLDGTIAQGTFIVT